MTKNKIYELKYYNEYQKMRFINQQDNETYRQLCFRLLGRVSRAEEYFDKDLYDFSLPQIERFLNYLNPTKLNTSRMNAYLVYNYIEWANTQNLRKTNIHPMLTIMSEDYFKSFIDESKQTIYSEEEIDDMVREIKNPVDAVLIQLMFEGVSGIGSAELLNLQKKNIDFENNRILFTGANESTRILEVSEKCMELIKGALDQTHYFKNNGNYVSDRGSSEIALVENDYVIKTSNLGRIKSFDRADKFLVHRKLKLIGDPDMFDKPYLSTKNLKYSGMLKIAKDFYLKDGTITKDCIDEIGKRFNIRKDKKGDYVVSLYKSDFLNEETIKKVYSRVDDLFVKE